MTETTMTRQDLIELKGKMAEFLRSHPKITRIPLPHPCWTDECVIRILVYGNVTTFGKFKSIVDKHIDGLQLKGELTLYHMRSLEHLCGVPVYEWEDEHPKPTPPEPFARWCRESDRLLAEFGSTAMHEEIEERWTMNCESRFAPTEIPTLEHGSSRVTFPSYRAFTQAMKDEPSKFDCDFVARMDAERRIVVDLKNEAA